MASTNGKRDASDILNALVEEEPVARSKQGRPSEPLDIAVVERFSAAFAKGTALGRSGIVTLAEARKIGNYLLRHAKAAAEQMDPPKSAALAVTTAAGTVAGKGTKDGDGPFHVRVQQTHRRVSKEEKEAAEKASAETPQAK